MRAEWFVPQHFYLRAKLAHAFIKEGKRVLVIDLDAQARLSIALGLSPNAIKEIGAPRFGGLAEVLLLCRSERALRAQTHD